MALKIFFTSLMIWVLSGRFEVAAKIVWPKTKVADRFASLGIASFIAGVVSLLFYIWG